ncbi:MAG TPA: hypothetical protein VFF58_00705 [Candidatus Nitrosotalea sp.]|nr:hypothetical protein [Candidatus Nitrosotalea sp.]
MSTAATVPVFDPQGTLRDVPEEQLAAAVKAGGMPAVKFQAPDKSTRFVPANRTQDAVSAGGKLLPFEQQDVKHPGFWHTVAEDFGSAVHTLAPVPAAVVDLATGASFKDVAGNLLHAAVPALRSADVAAGTPAEDAARKAAGRSIPYRFGAPVAETLGANVPGMEKSAASGDVGGVAGHFATAEAPYVGALAAPAAAPFAERMAARLSVPADSFAGHAARFVGKTAVDVATDVPVVRQLLNARKNWEATASSTPATYPGAPLPEHPGVFPGAQLPATPLPEQLNPSLVSEARTLPGQISPEVIRPPAQPIPARSGLMLPGEVAQQPKAVAQPEAGPPAPAPVSPNLGAPRTLSGEAALTQILGGQDNPNLLKIARSRGINVTREAQLKPGVADEILIKKIIEDFSPEELDNVRDTYLETNRTRSNMAEAHPGIWNSVGAEANKTLSMQTYFPEVKIPTSTLRRTYSSVQAARATATGTPEPAATTSAKGAVPDALLSIWQESLKQAQQKKAAQQP